LHKSCRVFGGRKNLVSLLIQHARLFRQAEYTKILCPARRPDGECVDPIHRRDVVQIVEGGDSFEHYRDEHLLVGESPSLLGASRQVVVGSRTVPALPRRPRGARDAATIPAA
jgi:hypothetical protein